MWQADSKKQEFDPDRIIGNNDSINNDMISEIEKELQDNPYDMISLVFLLYETPDTALQRLIVNQRISKDIGASTNLNMLHEWFRHAKHTPTWKHEFIEALLICQLNSILRKLGIHVPSARKYYQTDNIHIKTNMYINPVKKALYKLCEEMNADNMQRLKKSLLTYEIDTAEYDSCELVFLKLMCDKFITVNKFQYHRQTFGFTAELDNFLKIIENLPGLRKIAQDIRNLQHMLNQDSRPTAPIAVSTPSAALKVDESNQGMTNTHFEDVFDLLGELSIEDNTNTATLKSDRTKLDDDCFEIKSPDRLGVCVILNQVNFFPSKDSLETSQQCALSKRNGSDKDKMIIERTMKSLKFSVYSATDLDHIRMFQFLKEVIKTKVKEDDSMFMLCILSHGVRHHIFAADSVKVNVDDFQNLLDSDIAAKLHGKPKMLILQACQVDEIPRPTLVADSPGSSYNLKKTNFIIYWATAPELEAFRDESAGSIFIQMLFQTIVKYVNKEHACEIFTRVTKKVAYIGQHLGCPQVPIYHSTLLKKLYLRVPQ
ncbi:caspase-8-like [Anticarsia gemmatalis]|uniref:caspase-8-like n=1 Tax=Anticarsia gemmatalis TaxID=129554 RepID=UPI003F75AFDC